MRLFVELRFKSNNAQEPLMLENINYIKYCDATGKTHDVSSVSRLYEHMNTNVGALSFYSSDKSLTFVHLSDLLLLNIKEI